MKNHKRWMTFLTASILALGTISTPIYAEDAAQTAADSTEEEKITPETITYADSWNAIYEALNNSINRYEEEVYYETWDDDYEVEISYDAVPRTEAAAVTTELSTSDYSSTNLRDQAVDESDIVKTDGNYIYILQEGKYLTIVKADAAQSELVTKLPIYSSGVTDELLPADDNINYSDVREMFLSGDRMILILTEYHYADDPDYFWYSEEYTRVLSLDISDRTSPSLLGSYSQQGSYSQARRINGITYLYTIMSPNVGYLLSESDLSVTVNDKELAPQNFCIPKLVTNQSYLVYSSMADADPSSVQNVGVFVSGGEQFYVSENSLYVINSYWNRSKTQSQITRFSQEDGRMEGVASCTLNGYINNTWSVDEYQGNLRVLITYQSLDAAQVLSYLLQGESLSDSIYYSQDKRMNALIVFDDHLQKISRVGGIAKNEEIKSARFMGDTAYFVTYENTDPLFRADLSDPENPKLLDALKIDGFSSYLHPFGSDRLLGIGYDTDPDSGRVLGIKFTMFDTSEAHELTEIQTSVLSGITYCPSIENYKSIFVSPEKGMFGFYYEDRYFLYSYTEEDGFLSQTVYDLLAAGLGGVSNSNNMRGLYIGDEFYLAGKNYVAGFSLSGEEQNDFILNT